jgi:hypothetical protein
LPLFPEKTLYLDVTRKTFEFRYDKEMRKAAWHYIDHNAKLEAGVDFSDMCDRDSTARGTTCITLKFHTWPLRMKYNWVKNSGFYKHHKKRSWIGTMTAPGTRTVKPNEIGLMP